MSLRAYVPDASDVVWLEFDPQAGHKQAGHRPTDLEPLAKSPAWCGALSALRLD